MAFLKQDLLEKVRTKSAPIHQHPILNNGNVPLNVRNAYLQGCVFATLMDDGKVSDRERSKLLELARSIGLGDDELSDAISAVTSCEESDRLELISEILNQFTNVNTAVWFVIDFERMMAVSEKISDDGKELLTFIAKRMFGRDDWRLAAWQLEKTDCSPEAFNRYFWAAEDDDRYAQRIVGHCYLEGDVIDKDPRRGFKWLEKAAMQEYGAAQLDIARCYKDGRGTNVDADKAQTWYRKAAASGLQDAQKEMDQFIADRQIELYNQEVQRKEAERVKQEQAAARKAERLKAIQGELKETKDGYMTAAKAIGWVVSGIVAFMIWDWLTFWKFVLFGWIIICFSHPLILEIAKAIGKAAYDSYRQKKESEIENS